MTQTRSGDCEISGFRRVVNGNGALLGYYAATSGNFLPTFRDHLSVPSSGAKNSKESLLSQYRFYIGKSVGVEC
jgi:hypothetical protein